MKRADYNLDVDLDEPGLPRIGYDPDPPLDIDARPIDGGDLRAWRSRQAADTPSGRLTKREAVRQLTGTPGTLWSNWERRDVPPCWAALVREWALAGRQPTMPKERAAPTEVRAVVQAVGGYDVLAETLDYTIGSVRQWGRSKQAADHHRTGAGTKGGAGPLIRWLFEEFGLEPVEDIHPARVSSRTVLTPTDVRHIRRRFDDGESIARIAEDIDGAAYHVVRDAANRATYTWVD